MSSSIESTRVPVVLLVYNRPDHTRQVLEQLRIFRPSRLLIVADGPRADSRADRDSCAAVRSLVEDAVDWKVDISRQYASANMGLRDRVASGLTWAFDLVERAIVLEDDCVPTRSFFRFCSELLERFASEPRVGVITGNNFQPQPFECGASYYFSKFNHCWGWATWRRAWSHYDHGMSRWPELKARGWLGNLFSGEREVRYWTGIFDGVYEGRINSWAYAWKFCCWTQNLLTATPRVNLVSNIGFGPGGTHCLDPNCHLANRPRFELDDPLRHPTSVVLNEAADAFAQRTVFDPAPVTGGCIA